jgi:hypothetical protein
MIERGNFEPLSPKDLKDFDFNVLKLILTLRLIAAGLISNLIYVSPIHYIDTGSWAGDLQKIGKTSKFTYYRQI